MSFKVFVLLIIILFAGIFSYLKVQTLGNENSSFNRTTRYSLGKHPFYRSVLGLHKDGDARADFLMGKGPIAIEIAQAVGGGLNQSAIDSFAAKVQEYTGRVTHVYYIEGVKEGELSQTDLAHIKKVDKRNFEPGSPVLFVIYANDYNSVSEEVGKTFEEDTIVLSDKKLKDLTATNSQALAEYQESSLLHEFGHQMGLGHNQQENCIMNEVVESPVSSKYYFGSFTPTEFCPTELDELQAIKIRLR